MHSLYACTLLRPFFESPLRRPREALIKPECINCTRTQRGGDLPTSTPLLGLTDFHSKHKIFEFTVLQKMKEDVLEDVVDVWISGLEWRESVVWVEWRR